MKAEHRSRSGDADDELAAVGRTGGEFHVTAAEHKDLLALLPLQEQLLAARRHRWRADGLERSQHVHDQDCRTSPSSD